MTAIDRFLDMSASVFKVLAAACLAVMVALNMYNVLIRALFDTAYGSIFAWTMLLFAWMLLFGFYAYTRQRRDVIVDVLMTRLPLVLRQAGGMLSCLIGMAFMATILRAGPDLISMQFAPMDMIGLPIWTRSAPLFVSAAFVFVHFATQFVKIARGHLDPFPSATSQGGKA